LLQNKDTQVSNKTFDPINIQKAIFLPTWWALKPQEEHRPQAISKNLVHKISIGFSAQHIMGHSLCTMKHKIKHTEIPQRESSLLLHVCSTPLNV
jgi:hypothetical protein